jgi:membrane-associated protease RseP (regulator of RpoE activity)
MGHYLQARRYGVPATLPYFIPFPLSPFGTMGAVIVQGAGVADRKAMFDIAISGPLAGLVLALPATWFGLKYAQLVPLVSRPDELHFGVPLIVQWMIQHLIGCTILLSLSIQDRCCSPAGWEFLLPR